MQSIEILIVIVWVQYHAPALPGLSCGKRQTSIGRRINMTVCKNGLQPMKKEKAMLNNSAPPVSVSSKSVDYSSFLVFRTLRPR
jgi:hypothetical protein